MRVVHPARPPIPTSEGILPTAEDLECVRDLTRHFRPAGLRPVSLLPIDLRGGALPFVAHDEVSTSDRLDREEATPRTWLALESMQLTGSFKVRGAMHAVARRREVFRRRQGWHVAEPFVVVAASAGNHGVGVAYAAKVLDAQAEIVVPRGAARTKIEKIEAAGARVIVSSSRGYDDAEKEAMQLAKDRGAAFISPYDDMDVLVGNGASLAFEIVRALGRIPGVVYCPIGGGGLATGLACALRHELGARPPNGGTHPYRGGSSDISQLGIVIAAQSEASCAFATSLERDAAVTELPPAATIAEGLEGGISQRAFERARAVIDRVVVCEEQEIESAMRFAARELGIIVEGSAAVALVPALKLDFDPARSDGADTVIVITGRNIDADRLAAVLSA